MNKLEFYQSLQKIDLTIFSSRDISRIINKSPNYTNVFLSRMKKNNLLQSIEKGKYCKVDASEFEVASHILFPSYISFLSALNILGLSDQIPVEINLVAMKQKDSLLFNNYRINFHTFPKKLFFGYSKQNNIFVADPEKAILDSLYLNTVPLDEIVKILNDSEIDIQKLINYALKMDSKVLLKRLAYILDLLGFTELNELFSRINMNRFDILNPLLPSIGEKNKKFHLLINEVLL